MTSELEKAFDDAMLDLCKRTKAETGHDSKTFLSMIMDHRGRRTAQILLHSPAVQEGFTAVWMVGRLDLTVEALILQDQWSTLFTAEELAIAVKRLREHGYQDRHPLQ
jgi:hypothetical protein